MNEGLTYKDLTARVAEFLAVGDYSSSTDATDNRLQAPSDPNLLDRCQRAVNGGLQLLQMSNPSRRGWNVLRRSSELAVKADGSGPYQTRHDPLTVALPPEYQSHPLGSWSFKAAADSRPIPLVVTTLDRVLASRDAGGVGRPRVVTVVPNVQASAVGSVGMWAAKVGPVMPDGILYFSGLERVRPLAHDDDRHPFGMDFDELVLAAACFHAVRYDSANPRHEPAKEEFGRLLALAVQRDLDAVPPTLGFSEPGDVIETRRVSEAFVNGTRVYGG